MRDVAPLSTPCCVRGCEAAFAPHTRTWTLSADGWGEIEVSADFCCAHLDQMEGHGKPIIDLTIAGVEHV